MEQTTPEGILYGGARYHEPFAAGSITVYEDGQFLGWLLQDSTDSKEWSPSRVLQRIVDGLPHCVDLLELQAAIQEWYDEKR